MIYFITTPQFLGYSFNPISYYYCYDLHHNLKLVFLEVNNTFGEKHIYLMERDKPGNPKPRSGYTFAMVMPKEFHISPFNQRSGTYEVHIRDPLEQGPQNAMVDIKFVLYSDEDGKKVMVAGALSRDPAVDLLLGTTLQQTIEAVVRGAWSTCLAIIWTYYQAFSVYRKDTRSYTRPEVLPGSVQRTPTGMERYVYILRFLLIVDILTWANKIWDMQDHAGNVGAVFH